MRNHLKEDEAKELKLKESALYFLVISSNIVFVHNFFIFKIKN